MPSQQGLGRNDCGNLLEPAQPKALRLQGQPPPLIVAEPQALLAPQLPENSDLLLKIIDDVLLVPVDPACKRNQHESSDSHHGSLAENLPLHSLKQGNQRFEFSLIIRRLRRNRISGHYAPRNAANFGVGGDGTPQLLWRLANGGFDGLQPKVVVLMIGINNVWPGYSADDTSRGIRTFVARLREKMPSAKILLCGLLPIFDESDSIRYYIRTVNAGIAGLDDGKTVRFLDFSKDLLQPDGKRREGFYDSDRLHLKKPAYEAWAAAMEPMLGDWLAPEPETDKK
ncbi:GDSL-type esterase/lipase family protein [Luteolibacter sp. GHJ8]|uniref:GDSL-type esterase/lipase family protein n=1 Tax=Luteolibacter rhizosphaerae TaxID=2989719 RepID=A0ABT3FZC7_9BACT|nr:GDSL-type esterase/lipase family protein [Luteolibacter rhizosphaerae]MCW1912918.1 GDSL-type esterase/lipase family protein [Luteolibacter rhizosphaerae]